MLLKSNGEMNNKKKATIINRIVIAKLKFIFHLQQKGNKNKPINNALGWLSVPSGNICIYGNKEKIIKR